MSARSDSPVTDSYKGKVGDKPNAEETYLEDERALRSGAPKVGGIKGLLRDKKM